MLRFLAALILLCGFAAAAIAHPPYGLVVDRNGAIYFSDLETVWRLSQDGRLSVFRPAVAGTHVHELALAPNGAIEGDQNRYDPATERFYTGLWSRTPEGVERAIVPMTERPPPGAGVTQDQDENRYVTQWISNDDRRTQLLRRTPGARVDLLFDETEGKARHTTASVAGVGGTALGAGGSLYFAAGNRLRRWDPDGAVRTIYQGSSGSSLRGLAAASDGVLAADMGSKTVMAIAADGRATTLYRETGPWLPTAVILANGRLSVLEANADARDYDNRVRLIEVTNGRARLIALPGDAARPAPQASSPAEPSTQNRLMILLSGLAIAAALAVIFELRPKA